MTEEEQLAQLCCRLGAPPEQARIMAAQLLKRAAQLAQERGITRESAMAQLLQMVIKGRNGEGPEPPPPAPNRETI